LCIVLTLIRRCPILIGKPAVNTQVYVTWNTHAREGVTGELFIGGGWPGKGLSLIKPWILTANVLCPSSRQGRGYIDLGICFQMAVNGVGYGIPGWEGFETKLKIRYRGTGEIEKRSG